MYDQKKFNQLLHDPNVAIYYLPTIANTAGPGVSKYATVNQVEYVKAMLTQLNEQYQNTQQGLAYYSGDVDNNKIQPIANDRPTGIAKVNDGIRFDQAQFVNYVHNFNIKEHHQLPPESYEEHYQESDQFVDQITKHKHINMVDHVFLFTIFYDDRQTPTITIHSDSLFNDWAFNDWNKNAKPFHDVFQNQDSHHPIPYSFLYHNQVFGVDDLEVMETITHQTIQQANKIIDQCHQIDPKFKVEYAQKTEYINVDWLKTIFNDNFGEVYYEYPILLQDRLLTYDIEEDRLTLVKNTWLTKTLNPIFDQLNAIQQQNLLFKIANAIFSRNHREMGNQGSYQDPTSYRDELINHDQFKIDNQKLPDLPVMNHNSFVQQLSQLADEHTIVNPNHQITDQARPLIHFKVKFDYNFSQRFNYINQIYHQFINNQNQPQIDYYPDFTIQWYRTFLNLNQDHIYNLTGTIQTNQDQLPNVTKTLQTSLTDQNYVVNLFTFKSGLVDIVIQKTTEINQYNLVIVPARIYYQSKLPEINYRLAQSNLKTLNPVTNQRVLPSRSDKIEVASIDKHHQYETYVALTFDQLANNIYDYNGTEDRNQERIEAVKNNQNYQKFITNL